MHPSVGRLGGAADVVGGKSIGMGITLPFEAGLNPYVTPELAFEYHYFFTRKFWMAFHMQARARERHEAALSRRHA